MYTPNPIPTSHVQLPDALEVLIEKLAEHNHDVWSLNRLSDGWTWGTGRDDRLKTHPCLIPYAELPEKEKDIDRATAREVIKAVLALGYRIEPNGHVRE